MASPDRAATVHGWNSLGFGLRRLLAALLALALVHGDLAAGSWW